MMPANFWSDITIWIYLITVAICLYGSVLFFWWWREEARRNRGVSAVYIYVTFLLVGQGIQAQLALYARYLWILNEVEQYKMFLCSWMWHTRTIITLASCGAIVFHMAYRAITNKELGKKYEK